MTTLIVVPPTLRVFRAPRAKGRRGPRSRSPYSARMLSEVPVTRRRDAQGCLQKGEVLLIVLSPVALDLALVQFDPTETVTSNQ